MREKSKTLHLADAGFKEDMYSASESKNPIAGTER